MHPPAVSLVVAPQLVFVLVFCSVFHPTLKAPGHWGRGLLPCSHRAGTALQRGGASSCRWQRATLLSTCCSICEPTCCVIAATLCYCTLSPPPHFPTSRVHNLFSRLVYRMFILCVTPVTFSSIAPIHPCQSTLPPLAPTLPSHSPFVLHRSPSWVREESRPAYEALNTAFPAVVKAANLQDAGG